MNRWYVRTFVFVTIFVLLLEIVSIIFIPNKSNLLKFGLFNKAKYDILAEPDNSIDVVFLGDSLIYNSISPMYIWGEHGYATFDAAVPAMTTEEAYYYSKIIVKSQKPKLVLFEGDVMYRDMHNIQRYKYKVLDMKKAVPLLTFHNNWKQLFKKDWVNPYKGFKYSSKVDGPDRKRNLEKTDKKTAIDELNLYYFDKMMKLYKEHDIDVMFIESPTIYWDYEDHNGVAEIAEKYDMDILNLNVVDLGLEWDKETKDKGVHMNYLGARKVSHYMGNYLKEKNICEDHRKDPKYSLWHKAHKMYHEKLSD